MPEKRLTVLKTLLLLLFAATLSAAVTGKITGRVTDASTGQPLVGANVIVEDTGYGSFTDEDGNFAILNIRPGSYAVKASMIGYQALVLTGAEVRIGLTTSLNFDLPAAAIAMGEVVAVAEKPVVRMDIAASQMDVSNEAIVNMPVPDLDDVVELQAGIEAGLTIRGSEAYQTAYLVDGLSLNDERSNLPYTSIALNAVEQVQIQTGGFNAEYENVRSGVINVITKEGGRNSYGGAFTMTYAPPAAKHFGISPYDPMSYFARPYNDDAVAWNGTDWREEFVDANGNNRWDAGETFIDEDGDGAYTDWAWDQHTQDQYPYFEGFNALSEKLLTDEDPNNDLTPAALQRIYQYQHRRQGDITIPDYLVDIGLGGPVPGLQGKLGDLRFFLSYRGAQTAYVVPLSRPSYNDENMTLKVTSDINSNIKLTLSAMKGTHTSVSQATWTTLPTGSNNFYSTYSVAEAASTSYVLYVPGVYNPTRVDRANLGMKWTHQLNDRSFYEVDLSRMTNEYYTDRISPLDTTVAVEIMPGYFMGDEPFGYFANGPTTVVGMRTDWMGFAMDRSFNSTTTLKADYTLQTSANNEIKTGMNFVYTEYQIDSWNDHPTNAFWRYYNEWFQNPYRIGAYLQDKLEYKGMILNTGIRVDYSQANAEWFALDTYDDQLNSNNGFDLEESAERFKTKGVFKVSPRLAISHPISERAKIYFNYGHFNALSPSQYRFTVDRLGAGSVNKLGSPELEYATTVAYELGFEQNLMDKYLFKMAGYYKDVTNQPGWTTFINFDETVVYDVATSNNYEDIRGLEITFSKMRKAQSLVSGFINYTYHVETSGFFGIGNIYEDPGRQREYLRENPYQSRPRPRPFARANLDFHVPNSFGSAMGLQGLLGGWNINFIASWKAGAYSTYTPSKDVNIVNNVRWRDYQNLDLRISKTVPWNRYNFIVFLDVENLLNIKRLSSAGFSDIYDREDYLASLHFHDSPGEKKGDDKIGDYRDWNTEFVKFVYLENLDFSSVNALDYAVYHNAANDTWYRYESGSWVEVAHATIDTYVEEKAYIDMPNIQSFTFLDPRVVKFGFKLDF